MAYRLSAQGELSFVRPYFRKEFVIPDNLAEKVKFIRQPIPRKIRELDLTACVNLQKLPDEWLEGLEILIIDGCISIRELPKNLPASLKLISAKNCHKSLPKINRANLLEITDEEDEEDQIYRGIAEEKEVYVQEESLLAAEKDIELEKEEDAAEQDHDIDIENTSYDVFSLVKREENQLNLSEVSNLENKVRFHLNSDGKLTLLANNEPYESFKVPPNIASKVTSIADPLPDGLKNLDLSGCINLQSLPDLGDDLIMMTIEEEANLKKYLKKLNKKLLIRKLRNHQKKKDSKASKQENSGKKQEKWRKYLTMKKRANNKLSYVEKYLNHLQRKAVDMSNQRKNSRGKA